MLFCFSVQGTPGSDQPLLPTNTPANGETNPLDASNTSSDTPAPAVDEHAPELTSGREEIPGDILHNRNLDPTIEAIDAGTIPSTPVAGAYDLSPNTEPTEEVNGGAIQTQPFPLSSL